MGGLSGGKKVTPTTQYKDGCWPSLAPGEQRNQRDTRLKSSRVTRNGGLGRPVAAAAALDTVPYREGDENSETKQKKKEETKRGVWTRVGRVDETERVSRTGPLGVSRRDAKSSTDNWLSANANAGEPQEGERNTMGTNGAERRAKSA